MARSRLYQRTKNIIHGIQASVVLLAGIITIAIIAQNGGGDSRLTYFLVVCIATFPFLAYQTLVPTIKKTLRFANPYAHAGIDTLSTLLWLVAFLVEIVWVKDGSHAAKDWKKSDKVCNAFAWGSTTRCKLAQVTVGMGVAIECVPFPCRQLVQQRLIVA